ncbi:MAG: VanW family protein [Patescibacteria group bacterium]|jgi:vancomycin resistance protein YoaR
MHIKPKTKKILRIGLLAVAGLLALSLILFAGYSLFYSKKIFPRQHIGELDLGGMKKKSASEELSSNAGDVLKNPIKLIYMETGAEYSINPSDIGLQYDLDATVNSLWQVGRDERVAKAAWAQLETVYKDSVHPAVYTYNATQLAEKIASIAKEIDENAKDYTLEYNGDRFTLVDKRQEGKRLNQLKMNEAFQSCFQAIRCLDIAFERENYKPTITIENANAALAKANQIIDGGEITLTGSDQEIKIDKDTLAGFFGFVSDDANMKLSTNDTRIRKFSEALAKGIDNEPVSSKLIVENGKVTVFTPSKNGRSLNQDSVTESIKSLILARVSTNMAATDTKTIALVITEKKPDVADTDIASLGINEQIGTAMTNFKGSPVNRVHNLTVGAAALNGVLLKPGEEFSTLAHLGAIDASTGYLEELVIKDNSTTPEFGGGLCQVSSTLFRAALNSGMKITDRQNHKYRVSYYEPPVGMDATIYDPAPDFKFVNNYANSVLIQSRIEGTKIIFDFYGTKDSRKIEVSTPTVYDYTNPDPPVYVETPTMAAGETKRIEKSHQGATASFNYKVTAADGTDLQTRTFKSVYVPWQERWLVGTGTAVPANCSNGVQDGDETAVDMGGSCPKQS